MLSNSYGEEPIRARMAGGPDDELVARPHELPDQRGECSQNEPLISSASVDENPYKIERSWFKWPAWFNRKLRRAILVFAVLALFLWKYPRWALHRAHDHYIACINALYDRGAGDPDTCRQSLLLAIPRLVPWARHDALQLASDIDYSVAEDTLKLAALRSLDAAARDSSARGLVDRLGASPPPVPSFTPSSRLCSAGAKAVLIERAGEIGDAVARGDALVAAARLGDAAALARISALPPPRDPKYRPPLAAGIAQCIAGNRAAGIQLITAYNAGYIHDTGSESRDAQLALAACKPTDVDKIEVDEARAPRLAFVAAACGGRLSPIGQSESIDSDAGASLLIRATHNNATMDDVLGIISQRYIDELLAPPRPILSPWSLLDSPMGWPSTPAWADESAAHLGDLAATAKPRPRPRAATDEPDYFGRASQKAHENPAPYLRYGQLLLELEAAYGWARRGQLDKARTAALSARALAHTADIDPDAPILTIAALQLVGEWDTSLREIDGLTARGASPDLKGVLAIQRAVALAHQGKLDDAYAALDASIHLDLDPHTMDQLAWLRAALAIALDKPVDVALPKPPAKVDVLSTPTSALAYWVAAASASPEAQAQVRWKSYEELSDFDVAAVLPAVYLVVGRTAGHGDVELWLDALTGRTIDDPQAVASARAEAARWRGDTAAAKRWDDRLAAVRAIAKNDCTAYMLQLLTQP